MKKFIVSIITALTVVCSCTPDLKQQLMEQSISEISKTLKCPSSLVVRGATMVHIDIDSLRVSDSLYLTKMIKGETDSYMKRYYKSELRDFKEFDWSDYQTEDYILIAYDAQNSYGAMVRGYALFSYYGTTLGYNYTSSHFEKDKYGYFIGLIYFESEIRRDYSDSNYHPHYCISSDVSWVSFK